MIPVSTFPFSPEERMISVRDKTVS